MRYYFNNYILNQQWEDVCYPISIWSHYLIIEESKPKKQDVAFNRLPSLVKQWDKQQQENINKFQQ